VVSRTQTIDTIHTGIGYDGLPTAIFVAPPDAEPGSMEALTRFFNEQGYIARPGYSGRDKHHVLRLRSCESCDELTPEKIEELIFDAYPQWEENEDISNKVYEHRIDFSKAIQFESLEEFPKPRFGQIQEFIRENSTDMSALSYTVGNVGLVFSALFGGKEGDKQWSKLPVPLIYTTSSILLFLLNRHSEEPRHVRDIVDEVHDTLKNRGDLDEDVSEAEAKQELTDVTQHVITFMKEHPWEVSSLLNMVGAGTHLGAALANKQKVEAVSALGSLTAMAVAAFVPEQGTRGLLHDQIQGVIKSPPVQQVFKTIRMLEEYLPFVKPIFDMGRQLFDRVLKKPLMAAAGIQLVSNVGYGASALTRRDEDGNLCPDLGLLTTSMAYGSGNIFQAFSSKGGGPGFDDITTEAAFYVTAQLDPKDQAEEEIIEQIQEKIQTIAKELSEVPEIVYTPEALQRGIEQRMAFVQAKDPHQDPEKYVAGFIPMEQEVVASSPFVSKNVVDRAMTVDQGDAIITGSIVDENALNGLQPQSA